MQSIKCSETQTPLDINSIQFLTVTDSAMRSAILTSDLAASCELNSYLPFLHLWAAIGYRDWQAGWGAFERKAARYRAKYHLRSYF